MSQWWSEDWVQAAASILAVFIAFLSLLYSLRSEKHRQEWEEKRDREDKDFQIELLKQQVEYQKEMSKESRTPSATVTISPQDVANTIRPGGKFRPDLMVTRIVNTGPVDIYLIGPMLSIHLISNDTGDRFRGVNVAIAPYFYADEIEEEEYTQKLPNPLKPGMSASMMVRMHPSLHDLVDDLLALPPEEANNEEETGRPRVQPFSMQVEWDTQSGDSWKSPELMSDGWGKSAEERWKVV